MKQEDKTIQYIKSFLDNDYNALKTSLEVLLKDYERKSKRLDTIIRHSDNQQMQLLKLNEELEQYQNHLEEKVEEEIEKRKENEKMLLQQSKLAAMGEMMDAVAHQWKQPLSQINSVVANIEADFEDKKLNQEILDEHLNEIEKLTFYMSDTIQSFNNYLQPNDEKEVFSVKDAFDDAFTLVYKLFESKQI